MKRKIILILVLSLISIGLSAQDKQLNYEESLGKHKISLSLDTKTKKASYMYNRYKTPILLALKNQRHQKMEFIEQFPKKGSKGYSNGGTLTLSFNNSSHITGTYTNPKGTQTYPIDLRLVNSKPIKLKATVLEKLGFNSEEVPFFDEKVVGNDLVVVMGVGEKHQGGDLYVLICDKKGTIKSKYIQKDYWADEAEKISTIKVMDKSYKVKEHTQAIGVLTSYMTMGYSAMEYTDASLFVKEGNKLNRVLENQTVKYQSNISESSTKIVTDLKSKTNGYYDLKLIKTEVDIIEEGDDIIRKKQPENVKIMKFNNGSYN